MSVNPFDDDNGSFFVLVNDEEQQLARYSAEDFAREANGGPGSDE